jgi:hypothetical protein
MAEHRNSRYNVLVRLGKDIGLNFSTTLNSDKGNFKGLSPSTTPLWKEKVY